jgi:hypothetical protein
MLQGQFSVQRQTLKRSTLIKPLVLLCASSRDKENDGGGGGTGSSRMGFSLSMLLSLARASGGLRPYRETPRCGRQRNRCISVTFDTSRMHSQSLRRRPFCFGR